MLQYLLGQERLHFRGVFDNNEYLLNFAKTLEKVCIETVESGKMTKDLSILVSQNQKWLNTLGFFKYITTKIRRKITLVLKSHF